MTFQRGVYLVCDQPGCKIDSDDWYDLRGQRNPNELERKAALAGWKVAYDPSGAREPFHFCPEHAKSK